MRGQKSTSMQGLRRVEHLRAPALHEQVQGLRRIEHLRAPAAKESVQDCGGSSICEHQRRRIECKDRLAWDTILCTVEKGSGQTWFCGPFVPESGHLLRGRLNQHQGRRSRRCRGREASLYEAHIGSGDGAEMEEEEACLSRSGGLSTSAWMKGESCPTYHPTQPLLTASPTTQPRRPAAATSSPQTTSTRSPCAPARTQASTHPLLWLLLPRQWAEDDGASFCCPCGTAARHPELACRNHAPAPGCGAPGPHPRVSCVERWGGGTVSLVFEHRYQSIPIELVEEAKAECLRQCSRLVRFVGASRWTDRWWHMALMAAGRITSVIISPSTSFRPLQILPHPILFAYSSPSSRTIPSQCISYHTSSPHLLH